MIEASRAVVKAVLYDMDIEASDYLDFTTLLSVWYNYKI